MNSFDTDGRGPSEAQLLGYGTAMIVLILVVTLTMILKSTGRLDDYVRVTAELVNVGDGLPSRSDVRYHGLLVGAVAEVDPAAHGSPNVVHIDLRPEYAKRIPATVTARVIPSNVFAVSSVQLLDQDVNRDTAGIRPAIRDGARIQEDTTLPTVIFQTTVTKLRDVLAAIGRGRDDRSYGILAAVGAATERRGATLLAAGGQLTRILHELNGIVATDPGPSTVNALVGAARGLQSAAPELVDALHHAVEPMQTFAATRSQLSSVLSGTVRTLGSVRESFDNHTDQLIQITRDLTPVLGVFAIHSDTFVPIFARVKKLSDKFFDEAWIPEFDTGNMRINLSLTPTYTYTRADCPQYGELKGPSCYTAPEIAVRPDLPEVLLPQNYQPPVGLTPPPGTVIGPDGNLAAVGPPLVNPNPDLADPNPPLPGWAGPAPRVPGTGNPDDASTVQPPMPAAPASYGGTVGPVGSWQERAQLGFLTARGQPASVATQLLLGPVVRGTTVSLDRELVEKSR